VTELLCCRKAHLRAGNIDTSVCLSYLCALKQLLLSARLSHRNSVCPSVIRVDQSKTVQAKITKFSLSAARKTLVSGTVRKAFP